MCDNGPNICDSCQWVPGLTGNEGMHLFPFQILPPLTEQFLMGSRVAHKVGKPGCRQLSTDSIALRALPQFLRSKEEFALRVPREAHIRRATGDPLALDLRVGRTDVEGVEPDRNGGFDDFPCAGYLGHLFRKLAYCTR